MIDIDRLERAAREATPGPWDAVMEEELDNKGRIRGYVRVAGTIQAITGWGNVRQLEADAIHIALANPAVILELIERLRVAERALVDVHDKIVGNEEDGYGACRYCGSESYAVDEQGERLAGDEYGDAVEFHIDHNPACPVTIVSDALPPPPPA